nr:serine/threonine-protein kinase [Streptomyces sp. SID12501]
MRPVDPEHIGPYVPLALLGSGGMGRVYLARPSDDGPGLFAVKVIRPEYAEDPTFRRRFEQEALVHGRVRSPRAPRLCGTGFQDELLWMATEYLAALDLADAVREDGVLGPGAVWRLVAELGQALADLAATGIVHRDLKPSNVLLSLRGAHVIDFGISKAADASAITGTGNRVGTPAYMSPEYLRTGHCDETSDVFSLAGTLIYAAVGRAPFGDGTGVDVMHRVAFEEPDAEVIGEISAIDPALGALLAACLSKEPERRPTPRALVQAARECAGESAEASRWPEPLLGRVLERQRAYDVLYSVPVARVAELRLQGHRPNPASALPVPAKGAAPVPAADPAVPAVASDETSPGRRRPKGAVAWARRRPVPAVAAALAVCALAALGFVLARPSDQEASAVPGPGTTASADTAAEAGDALPKPGTSDGKSVPSTSGNGTETADGPADPSQVANDTDDTDGDGDAGNDPTDPDTSTGTDTTAGTGTGTGTDPGTDPSTGTDGGTAATPTPTPSPVTSTTEPASAPWVTDCTYYAGKVRTAIGDTGKRVKQVQCILMLRGYDIGGTGVDGVFGEGLEAAMKNFQVDKGLAVNGIVKRATWDNLRASK